MKVARPPTPSPEAGGREGWTGAPAPHKAALARSFGFAWEGVVRTAQRERNMRIHLFAALCVGLAGIEVRLAASARLALLLAVALVIAAEVLNSALEAVVDLHTTAFHPKAKIAKDAAAGAVLVLAAGSVLVGLAILADAWPEVRRAAAHLGWRAVAHAAVIAGAARLLVPPRRRAADRATALVAVAAQLALWPATASVAFAALASLTLAVIAAAALATATPTRSS